MAIKARKSPEKSPQKYTYKPLTSDDLSFSWAEKARTCCGVLEIGFDDYNDISATLDSVETKTEKQDRYQSHRNGRYDPHLGLVDVAVPAHSRSATEEELFSAFSKYIKSETSYGKAVMYLLPNQHNGRIGRIIKKLGWEYHGSFRNPKTRHIVHHWSVTLRKVTTRSKKRKSILSK